MMRSNPFSRPLRLLKTGLDLIRLPRVHLQFHRAGTPAQINSVFKIFTQRHARLPVIRNKTMGIALIDLRNFKTRSEYLATVDKKDFAAHHARRAAKLGYTMRVIDRNDFIDQIHAIHMSASQRQGRAMDEIYLSRVIRYAVGPPFVCYGVFDEQNQLSAYCNIGIYGNFAATDRVIGYKSKNGNMHLLLSEIICMLIDEKKLQFFMYDTYIGAKTGLQDFKKRAGFKPYRVHYSIE